MFCISIVCVVSFPTLSYTVNSYVPLSYTVYVPVELLLYLPFGNFILATPLFRSSDVHVMSTLSATQSCLAFKFSVGFSLSIIIVSSTTSDTFVLLFFVFYNFLLYRTL